MNETDVDKDSTRLHALVHGRVQGVFFRDYVRANAQRLRLVGWVRNLSDGRTVEVIAQGPRLTLEALLAHLYQGPPGSHVVEVDVDWMSAWSEFDTFRIR